MVDAAVWTLVGFGIAGALSFANNWLLEDRRTALQWRKEREDELRDALVATKLIADELDTHAMNYEMLLTLERSPMRPIAQYPNFLSSKEWDVHKTALARLPFIPVETWAGLSNNFHNALGLRSRLEVDGINVPFPPDRLPLLKDHAEAATELAGILRDASEKITQRLQPRPRKRLGRIG